MHSSLKLTAVESSAILKVGYCNNALFVQFVGGQWYKYLQVSETVFEQLLAAPSKGAFINKSVKPFYKVKPLTNQELEMVCRTFL